MGISNVISLLSGVALFLFGMSLMGDGLKKVAGDQLEIILYKLTNTPVKGVLLGTGVTAVIQSSSATSVMVVGFVNSGMMQVRQAIGIVLGAILGTSITGWILCLSDISGSGWISLLSTSTLTGVVAVVGIVLRMFSKNQTKVHVGDILLGFAVLMFGMQAMSGAVSPLRESEAFIRLLTKFSNPLLGILVGTLFTCVLQSASAAVGILQALAITGTIDFAVAFPITMGIAIGAAVPVLLSALGASVDGRRTAFAYLLIDVIGAILWTAVFYTLNAFFHFSFLHATMSAVSVALLNTLFRLGTLLVLTPQIGLLEKLVCLLIRDRHAGQTPGTDVDRLEERFLDHPALAIEQSRLVADSMAHMAQENLRAAFALLHQFDDGAFRAVQDAEEAVDRYEDKLGTYLIKITSRELNPRQTADVSKYLHTIGDFERMSDHALNIAETAQEMHGKKIRFSPDGTRELRVMVAAVQEIITLAIEAFTRNDIETAYKVEPLEELIDNLCDEMKLHHIDRLQAGVCTLSHGFAFNDLLTNCERISDHCSNIAVALIELESDSFDAHEYLNSLMAARTHSFDRYYAEYSQKYQL